jgi:hypothetical protein
MKDIRNTGLIEPIPRLLHGVAVGNAVQGKGHGATSAVEERETVT